MECLNLPLALHTLVGVSLIIAGTNLMLQQGRMARGYGAYCFAFGYFILGVSASGHDIGTFSQSQRFMLGLGSAVAVVAGTFMMYYHIQDRIRQTITGDFSGDIIKSIPIIDHVLVYAGFAGLVLAIAMRDDNSFNLTKAALAIGAFLVIGYTKTRMLEAVVKGQNAERQQLAHVLSWGLLVLAVAYSC